MKKYIFLLLTSILYFGFNSNSQSVDVSSLKTGSAVDVPFLVEFSAATIELDNSSIKCQKLTIKKEVKKIKITGAVTINCADFELEAEVGGTSIQLDCTSGSLNIEYSGTFTNSRKLSISDMKNFRISLSKR